MSVLEGICGVEFLKLMLLLPVETDRIQANVFIAGLGWLSWSPPNTAETFFACNAEMPKFGAL